MSKTTLTTEVTDGFIVNVACGGNYNGLFQVWDADGNEISDEKEKRLLALFGASQELLEAAKFFMGALNDGDIVRDITRDAKPEWALKMMRFAIELGKANTAISKAEG
jgi:hypothetical protein